MPVSDLTAILLAGGLGTRIRQLHPDLPKPLIPVAGKPFLEWLIQYWQAQGVRRFVLSTGYRSEAVQQFLDSRSFPNCSAIAVREDEPLGTGGAIRHAVQFAECSDPFIVANGDSIAPADLSSVWPALADPSIDGWIVAVEMEDVSRYGSVDAGPNDELTGFREKVSGQGWINAGIYILKRRLLEMFPKSKPLSMEREVFPSLLQNGARVKTLRAKVPLLDIGTPESLAIADDFVRRYLAPPRAG